MNHSEMLAAAKSDSLEGKLLTFQIQQAVYGVELDHVIEIISIQFITTVPNVPTYIKGIINLRGKIVPVLDVRLKLGLDELAYDDKTCIVVVNVNEMQVGLIVDRVSEVVNVNQSNLFQIPELSQKKEHQYLQSIAQIDGKIILNLDFDSFFNDDLMHTM